MRNYNDENLLDIVELYASEMGYISSEEELSEQFDTNIMPSILEAHGQPGVDFTDEAMISEEFNNWTDGLCKEGVIHPEQYNQYCYVGDWS